MKADGLGVDGDQSWFPGLRPGLRASVWRCSMGE